MVGGVHNRSHQGSVMTATTQKAIQMYPRLPSKGQIPIVVSSNSDLEER